jgi:hypothetical protein
MLSITVSRDSVRVVRKEQGGQKKDPALPSLPLPLLCPFLPPLDGSDVPSARGGWRL